MIRNMFLMISLNKTKQAILEFYGTAFGTIFWYEIYSFFLFTPSRELAWCQQSAELHNF
jgi:hypothetical protein